ncbi:hypothetical protein ACN083_06190 [Rothia sp. CCM 9418]|uniref:hypothetical protein n=1 Tax=Rothia sp. CCM 9418 TaxID=3402661 RepID=UPI003AE975C5
MAPPSPDGQVMAGPEQGLLRGVVVSSRVSDSPGVVGAFPAGILTNHMIKPGDIL